MHLGEQIQVVRNDHCAWFQRQLPHTDKNHGRMNLACSDLKILRLDV